MAKGLAVIKGRNTIVFKALEDGTIKFGNDGLDGKPAIDAAVSLKGSLKLDITGKDAGNFLKSIDADGNAEWAQIVAADVDVAASGLDLESHLSVLEAELGGDLSAETSARKAADDQLDTDLSAETAARIAADSALDARLTTAEGEIGSLQTELSTLIGGSTEEFGQTLSTIKEIQEYLDGDGVDVQELVSVAGVGIGDLTSYTSNLSAQLSADIAELSNGSGGDIEAVSTALEQEILDRAAGDATVSADASAALSSEVSARIADVQDAEATAAAELSSEVSARIADVNAEETRASAAEYGLSVAIEDLDAEVSTVLSSSVIDVDGTANEVEVSIIDSVNGKTAVIGLPDDVNIAQDLSVGRYLTVEDATSLNGDVTLGNSPTADKVIVNGNFQVPRMTRAQAIEVYGYDTNNDGTNDVLLNPTDHAADWATAGANDGHGFNGHMFYLVDDHAASDDDLFPEGNKWYMCENGVWYASFFYTGS